MGLIQRVIEAVGIPTISISLNRTITERVKPPRALLVDFPPGHPMGHPFDKETQRRILMEALKHLTRITEPGTIVGLRELYRVEGEKRQLCTVEVG